MLSLSDQNVLYASIMLALVRTNGQVILNRFYREINTCPEFSGSTTNGAVNQARNWAAAIAVSARTNLVPLLTGRWKFPLPHNDLARFANLPVDGSETAGFLVEQLLKETQVNLLQNGSFEEGMASWSLSSWRGDPLSAQVVANVHFDGQQALLLQATNLSDDVACLQVVTVQPNTRYLLSGRVRTEGVIIQQEGGTTSAVLHLGGTWAKSNSFEGDHDWTYVAMSFKTGSETSVSVGPRLGYWYSTVTGKAWFDSLSLIQVPE